MTGIISGSDYTTIGRAQKRSKHSNQRLDCSVASTQINSANSTYSFADTLVLYDEIADFPLPPPSTGSASDFDYGAEEPPAFCPRTHASMFFQSGSSLDLNCLPPWCVSARPPASGARGMSKKILESGSPGVTSFDTTSKLCRDCSSVQKLAPARSASRLNRPPPCRLRSWHT